MLVSWWQRHNVDKTPEIDRGRRPGEVKLCRRSCRPPLQATLRFSWSCSVACWDLKLLWQIRHSDQAVGRIPLYVSLYSNLIKFCLLSEENLLSVATLDDSFQSPAFISVQFFCLASCSPSQSDLCVGFFVKQLTRMWNVVMKELLSD